MEITYRREPNQSGMIVKNIKSGPFYQERMIEENNVSCLLSFSRMETGTDKTAWFDISGRKSLKNYFLREGITAMSVYLALKSLKEALDELAGYLISPENILFSPETIFLKGEEFDLITGLAYCPGGDLDFVSCLTKLGEYLIRNVDHEDKKAVSACYTVFETVNRKDVTLPELIEKIEPFVKEEEIKEISDYYVKEEEPVFEDETEEYENREVFMDRPPWFDDKEDIFESPPKKKGILSSVFGKKDKRRKKAKINGFEPEEHYINKEDSGVILESIREDEAQVFGKTVLLSAEAKEGGYRRLVYEGRGSKTDMFIEKTPFVIGSNSNNCDGIIPESVISRAHARIVEIEGEYYLEDLESKNGTFLNGQILDFNKQARLSLGDAISFANVGYRFM